MLLAGERATEDYSLGRPGPYLLVVAEPRQRLAQCQAQRGTCKELLSEEHTAE